MSSKAGPAKQAIGHRSVRRAEQTNAEERSNIFSRLTYQYFSPLMALGASRALEHEDMYVLEDQDTADHNAARLGQIWSEEVASGSPDLGRAIRKLAGNNLWLVLVISLLAGLLPFAAPLLLQLTIQWLEDDKAPLSTGLVYCALMVASPFAASITQNYGLRVVGRMGVHWRAGMNSLIFRKSLSLTSDARATVDHGKIVSYMSTDTEAVFDLIFVLVNCITVPVRIILCLVYLAILLKLAVFGALIAALLFIPMNTYYARQSAKLNQQKLTIADKRVALMNEMLTGMKVIKLNAYEEPFLEQITEKREEELTVLRLMAYVSVTLRVSVVIAPTAIFLGAILFYAAVYEAPTAEVVFVSFNLLGLLRMPLTSAPQLVLNYIHARQSADRIEKFMLLDEQPEGAATVRPIRKDRVVAHIKGGSFQWATVPAPEEDEGDAKGKMETKSEEDVGDEKGQKETKSKRDGGDGGADKPPTDSGKHTDTNAGEEVAQGEGGGGEEAALLSGREYALRDINLRVKQGELIMIVGPVGSGKSSLLAALLGEIKAVEGLVSLRGSVAYIPQTAWILNMTLRENILLGRQDLESEVDETVYQAVLDACALRADIAMLPAGDQTEIGEKGINLSGGQKQRVSIARALYSDAQTYIIDDPLSAVDAHVGKHLFKEVINGRLRGTTRIMTTNQLQYLPMADNVVVLAEDGTIAETGTFSRLIADNGPFADMFQSHMGTAEAETDASESATVSARTSMHGTGDGESDRDGEKDGAGGAEEGGSKASKKEGEIIKSEKRLRGQVEWSTYLAYFVALGGAAYLICWVAIYVTPQALRNFSSVWLSWWIDDKFERNLNWYMWMYVGIVAVSAIGILLRELWFVKGRLNASRVMHDAALQAVARSPMEFFDTTPQGRVLARFSRDIKQLDQNLPSVLSGLLLLVVILSGLLITVAVIVPYYIIAIVLAAPVYYYVSKYYRYSGVELKRIESIARSPIFNHFGECLTGADSIRAYKLQSRCQEDLHERIDASNEAFTSSLLAKRWMSVRLGIVGAILLTGCSLAVVLMKSVIPASLGALALSYSLGSASLLEMLVSVVSFTEQVMNCVERLTEFSNLPSEAPSDIPDNRPPAAWPQKGKISFDNVSMRYREGLPLVLKNLTAKIHGGEKVGVVGRTGSGKSSLMLLLFRIVEAAEGSIVIDSRDIAGLGLKDLRKRLAIIPQDPVLFTGSFRQNLDPFNDYTDTEVERVIDMALLRGVVNDLEGGINGTITEGGSNLSVGQRQLVCLARALLKKPKILVLDEATASVDFDTDLAIQKTVRTAFKSATTLTIAHRLNTIVDSDRVMVLDEGELAEFDTPAALLSNEDGIFYHLVNETGAASASHLTEIAQGKKSYLDMLASESMVIEELQRTTSGLSRESSTTTDLRTTSMTPRARDKPAAGFPETRQGRRSSVERIASSVAAAVAADGEGMFVVEQSTDDDGMGSVGLSDTDSDFDQRVASLAKVHTPKGDRGDPWIVRSSLPPSAESSPRGPVSARGGGNKGKAPRKSPRQRRGSSSESRSSSILLDMSSSL